MILLMYKRWKGIKMEQIVAWIFIIGVGILIVSVSNRKIERQDEKVMR